MAFLATSNFSTLSHKWHNFQIIVTELKMCVLILSITCVRNISHSKKNNSIVICMCIFLLLVWVSWLFTVYSVGCKIGLVSTCVRAWLY